MNILLLGGSTKNKGDELMLNAVVQHFQQYEKNIKLVKDLYYGKYEDRAKLKLRHLLWKPNLSSLHGTIGYLILKRYGRSFGIIAESDVDIIIDFSGFRYSDRWKRRGPIWTKEFAQKTMKWKKEGKKIILLPQAFGPFQNIDTKKAFKEITVNTDLIIARDSVSLNYIKDISDNTVNIMKYPDFTNLVTPNCPDRFKYHDRMVTIVPNSKMMEKTNQKIKAKYLKFLNYCTALNYQKKMASVRFYCCMKSMLIKI